MPTSASRRGTVSLHIKVNTGAGGKVLPLQVFWCLYPNQINPAGLPTGLDHVSTRLTAYNGSHIPLNGALHGPITWWPGHPGALPHQVNSYWYITDTPGPAILGLPSCERLAVVKMNIVPSQSWDLAQNLPSPAPVSTTATTAKPATVHAAAKSIRSTDDLIKEFPDHFTGIGGFPGEYKIWLWHDVHPIIHAPRKFPIALCLKVKEHLNKMECLGVVTCVDEPTDWVSSITYIQKANGKLCLYLDPMTLMRPSAEIITRHPLWRKLLMSLSTLASSPSWMHTMDTGQSSSTRSQPAYDIQQPLQKILFPVTSLWPCLFPRHLPEEDGSDPRRVPRMHWNHRWHHHPWPHWGRTWCLPTKPYADCPQIRFGV